MRCGGRVRSFSFVSFFSRTLYLFANNVVFSESAEYGVPIEIKLWDTGQTPLAHMVDVTNGFGLKVLAEHNFLNDNNIAFSPYGLMGILIALYEGVDGDSSYQLQRGIQLPWNRKVMRIGFRDIHRTLKTYFVPEEGFLAGLALNNENVTFNESYKKILRFYGFDLDNDQLPTFPPQGNNSTANESIASAPMSDASTLPTIETTTLTSTVSITTEKKPREETTPTPPNSESTGNPNAETINPASSTMASSSAAPNAESTPITTTSVITTITSTSKGTAATETTIPSSMMTTSVTSTEKQMGLSSNEITTVTTTNLTNLQITTDKMLETSSRPGETVTSNDVDIPVGGDVTTSTIISTTDIPTTSVFSTTVTGTETTTIIMTTNSESEPTSSSTVDMTTTTDTSTTIANNTQLETLERRKKSIVDFIFTNPPYDYDYVSYRSFDIPADLPSSNSDDKMFLANGLKSVQVKYMHYDTVLEHAYLPHLEASALRLPLDSERYYLLVVLPARRGPTELDRLLSRMARESDLSDIYASLRPRRVRGSVPSFIVKGHVTLTTDLQKLGIRNVFEPRQHDFILMTRQAGVYVRSIEQAVSVAIRKYQPDDHKRNRYVTDREKITFYATYPFLYFVMDASIHVSLMAGKMVDPLNTRIL